MSDTTVINIEQVELSAEKREARIPSVRMLEIRDMIEDPNQGVAEINRNIAGEIASVTADISCIEQSSAYKLKFFTEQIKALRELSKTLSESEVLSKKDILNFDGPKFQYVFQEIVGVVRKSAKESGLSEDQINAMLRSFRDTMSLKEPELRKQTEKVDSSFVSKR